MGRLHDLIDLGLCYWWHRTAIALAEEKRKPAVLCENFDVYQLRTPPRITVLETLKIPCESAALDYERALALQGSRFATLGNHNRGELLFGLASAWSMLGDQVKTRAYLQQIVAACKGSSYETEARSWLQQNPIPVVRHACQGCHVH